MPQNVVPQRVNVNAFPVLAGHDDRRHPARPVLPVVFHRDLRFPVGEKVLQFIAAAHQFQPLRQRVGQLDGQRHPVDGFLTGIAKQNALISGAGVDAFRLVSAGNAPCDIRGLLVQIYFDPARFRVKAPVRFRISNFLNDPPGKAGIIHFRLRGDFPENVYRIGGAGHLAGNTGLGVLFQQRVQNSVRDLVADFIRMAAGDGFRGKIVSVHNILPRMTELSSSGGIPPDNDNFTPFPPK